MAGDRPLLSPPLSPLAGDPAAPRSPILRILITGRLLAPLGILLGSLVASILIAVLLYLEVETGLSLPAVLLGLCLAAVLAGLIGVGRLNSQLLRPLVRLEQSVADVCQGEPEAVQPMNQAGVLGAVMRDLGTLNEELTAVYEDMDNRVTRQTRRLAQQTASLKILYDVAAGINRADRIDELLLRYLEVLQKMLNARAGVVRLQTPDGRVRLLGSIDPDGRLHSIVEQYPLRLCSCGRVLSEGDILCEQDPRSCSRSLGRRMYGRDRMETVEIPLEYHGDRLGAYTLYVERPGLAGREEWLPLLAAIGNHLGMALAKHRSDEEAHRLSIIEERTQLAHELHDSLAQTLASLRFQVRMLEETLVKDNAPETARAELHRLRNGVDEAHTELRELLTSFLAPVDQRGLIPALEKLVQRFRQETGIQTFFQRTCSQVTLGASEELQILRIVQECLANIRKHAQAHTVRVLLSCSGAEGYQLLVEDDGVGFDDRRPEGSPGEHIGLSIMEERARRLGGELRIESEPGEGTRVELTYNPESDQNSRDAKESA